MEVKTEDVTIQLIQNIYKNYINILKEKLLIKKQNKKQNKKTTITNIKISKIKTNLQY